MSSLKKSCLSADFPEKTPPNQASTKTTSNNAFLNFLSEFRKITASVKMTSSQLSRIGGELWRRMSGAQKSQFTIVEAKRRRKKAHGVKKSRRRRRRHH